MCLKPEQVNKKLHPIQPFSIRGRSFFSHLTDHFRLGFRRQASLFSISDIYSSNSPHFFDNFGYT